MLIAEEMQSLEEIGGFEGGEPETPLGDILGISAPPDLHEITQPIIEPLIELAGGFATADAIYQAIQANSPDVTCIAENADDLKTMVEDTTTCFLVLIPPGTYLELDSPITVSTFKVSI